MFKVCTGEVFVTHQENENFEDSMTVLADQGNAIERYCKESIVETEYNVLLRSIEESLLESRCYDEIFFNAIISTIKTLNDSRDNVTFNTLVKAIGPYLTFDDLSILSKTSMIRTAALRTVVNQKDPETKKGKSATSSIVSNACSPNYVYDKKNTVPYLEEAIAKKISLYNVTVNHGGSENHYKRFVHQAVTYHTELYNKYKEMMGTIRNKKPEPPLAILITRMLRDKKNMVEIIDAYPQLVQNGEFTIVYNKSIFEKFHEDGCLLEGFLRQYKDAFRNETTEEDFLAEDWKLGQTSKQVDEEPRRKAIAYVKEHGLPFTNKILHSIAKRFI